jgi:hypothetical protein
MGMVKLTSEQQDMLCAAESAMFVPVKGGWGRKGATNVRLAAVDAASPRGALMTHGETRRRRHCRGMGRAHRNPSF